MDVPSAASAETEQEAPRLYARFSRRFRALVLDSVVYAGSIAALIALLEAAGRGRSHAGVIIGTWLGFLFLYEPVLVWRRGATLGHAYTNIHVVDLRTGGNPTFLRAFGRFWLKGLFGLLAFVFMGTTRRHQALHDLAFGTTVEIRDPSRATDLDYVTERSPELLRVSVPAWRRVLVILAYSLVNLAASSARAVGRLLACTPERPRGSVGPVTSSPEVCMIRHPVIISLVLSALPSALCAQFELSIGAGVHVDRAPEHDRVVTDGGAAMYADQGEASALGIRLGYWRSPKLGFQLDLSRSSNASWSGSTPLPPPTFANRTTYLSLRAATRTEPVKPMQLVLAAGPALMIYSGTGTNLRARGADVGGVVEGSARLRIVRQLAFELAVSNYFYRSSYRADPTQGGQADAPRNVFRHDLLLLPRLVYAWH